MKWLISISLIARAFACQTVDGDRILARDLAAANPKFVSMDPESPVAPAPLPGAVRVMHAAELLRMAHAAGIELGTPVADVCFERFTEPLNAEKLLPLLRDALNVENASIEVVDFVRVGVPRGTLEFSRSGLNASGLWRGQVMYGAARSIPIWVKVRVSVERTWVEASRPITAGKIVDASELIVRTGPRFPFGPMPAAAIDHIAGRAAVRSIRAGEPIFVNMTTKPREVERGDTVSVEVTSGEAKIAFDATAESSGHTGESILIRNPENGRYFQARIDGKDKVIVTK